MGVRLLGEINENHFKILLNWVMTAIAANILISVIVNKLNRAQLTPRTKVRTFRLISPKYDLICDPEFVWHPLYSL